MNKDFKKTFIKGLIGLFKTLLMIATGFFIFIIWLTIALALDSGKKGR